MKHAYVPRTTTYGLNPGDELNDLRMSDEVRPLYEHVKKFIRETVDPMSAEFYRLGENKPDRWSFTRRPDRGAGEGQGKGQGRRPVEFLPARRRDRRGPEEPRLRLYRGRARQKSAGLGDHELLGAGHRQHGGAGARRHPRAEGEVAEAAAGRRNPFRLRHDRAQCRLVGRQEHLDHGQAGRRRMGDQRREILHLRPRRSPLQDHDRDGEDQPGRAAEQAAVADPGAQGHARRRDHRADACVRPRPCAARPHASALRQCPGAEGEHPARRRPRLRDLAGAARARAASITACARSARRKRRST